MKTIARKDNSSEVKRRIFELIDNMSEFEVRNLYIGLEKWKQSKHKGRRKHPRKDISIFGLFQNESLSFREYIKNLSAGGLFIETGIPISVRHELLMQFIHPYSKNVIKANGKIVRIDPNGIGVKFHSPLQI